MQTLVLLPLCYVVIFSADTSTFVIVNTVAAQVFASLDDEFVVAFLDPHGFKREALETYCQKAKTAEAKAVL